MELGRGTPSGSSRSCLTAAYAGCVLPIHDLARNTRTSIAMIDKHYAQVQVERMKESLRPEWGNR